MSIVSVFVVVDTFCPPPEQRSFGAGRLATGGACRVGEVLVVRALAREQNGGRGSVGVAGETEVGGSGVLWGILPPGFIGGEGEAFGEVAVVQVIWKMR